MVLASQKKDEYPIIHVHCIFHQLKQKRSDLMRVIYKGPSVVRAGIKDNSKSFLQFIYLYRITFSRKLS